MSPRVDHKKPVIGFVIVLVLAVVVVGHGLRAEALPFRFLAAGPIGLDASGHGSLVWSPEGAAAVEDRVHVDHSSPTAPVDVVDVVDEGTAPSAPAVDLSKEAAGTSKTGPSKTGPSKTGPSKTHMGKAAAKARSHHLHPAKLDQGKRGSRGRDRGHAVGRALGAAHHHAAHTARAVGPAALGHGRHGALLHPHAAHAQRGSGRFGHDRPTVARSRHGHGASR